MLPLVAIVGRPNVGKSTLFNVLTGTRDALVADQPGVTRDRNYALARGPSRTFIAIDTGGLSDAPDPIARMTGKQADAAIRESDLVLLVVDAREGLNAEDQRIASELRAVAARVIVVANKVDGLDPTLAALDFHALGFDAVLAISAAHKRGIRSLLDALESALPDAVDSRHDLPETSGAIRVAVVGRPNVGKSTLVNRLSGSERVVAHELPGTTRDSVKVPFVYKDQAFELIDTAGVRRRARVTEAVEKFSIVKTLDAIESCHVAALLMDARAGVSEQDLHLLGLILSSGRALVLVGNKWDGLDATTRRRFSDELARRTRFADFATTVTISARHGSGLDAMMSAIVEAHRAANAKLPTPELTRVLRDALERSPPPTVRGRRIKLRYAHQGGSNPPRIVIHGNQTESLPGHYHRYLARTFREAFSLYGTPIAIELRTSDNPYKGRRNTLTPRQQRKRKRLIKRIKRSGRG